MTRDGLPILDQSVLDELRAAVGDDEEFVRDLAQTYVTESEAHVEALASAAKDGDAAAIVRPAHTLKSSSASIGAMRLSEIARELEAAGREGRAGALADGAAAASEAWAATLQALLSAGLVG